MLFPERKHSFKWCRQSSDDRSSESNNKYESGKWFLAVFIIWSDDEQLWSPPLLLLLQETEKSILWQGVCPPPGRSFNFRIFMSSALFQAASQWWWPPSKAYDRDSVWLRRAENGARAQSVLQNCTALDQPGDAGVFLNGEWRRKVLGPEVDLGLFLDRCGSSLWIFACNMKAGFWKQTLLHNTYCI